MTANFSNLTEETRISLKEVHEKWADPKHSEDITLPYDYNSKVLAKMREGDINGMKAAALPAVQYEVIRLALEGKAEQTRLQASQTVLGQMGHGPIQRVEHSMNYDQMPADQLSAVIASKLARVVQLIPSLDVPKILESARQKSSASAAEQTVIEGEFESV